MPIFLILSGYFFRVANRDVGSKAIVVFRRVVVPYLVFVSIYLLALYGCGKMGISTSNQAPVSVVGFLHDVLHARGAYWFLHSLALLQITVLIVIKLSHDCHGMWSRSSVVLAILLLSCLSSLGWLKAWVCMFFLIGTLGYRFVYQGQKVPLVMTISSFFVIIQWWGVDIAKDSFIGVAWCLSVLCLLYTFIQMYSETAIVAVLAWFGRNSISILVWHALFVVGMKCLNNILLLLDSTGTLQVFVVTFCASIFPLLMARIMDACGASKLVFGQREIYSPFRLGS
jgi:fucose 4-O-acetylase-like acetyltransferase